MKKNKGFVVIILILALVVGLGVYCVDILNATNTKADKGLILGLDLSGGVSITYKIVTENPSATDIADTIAKMEERAENYSTEYAVYQVGEDRITVEIPGVFDANAVLEELGSPGALYFIVQENEDGKDNYSYDDTSEEDVPYKLNYTLEELIENGSVILTGNDVVSADAGYTTDQYGNNEPVVQLKFTAEGAKIFAEATAEAAKSKDSIALYYNDHFISVPTVTETISNGECTISGHANFAEADELATFIRIGAISLKLEELESNVVGAQLGSQALSTSILAAAIGLVLVMLFMIALYRLPGVVASFGLAIYIFGTIVLIQWLEITLTLPGIAGVILGIGMAVDANVITFSRIREEIAEGHSPYAAIRDGYKKALSAIVDGNVTTFIAAIVLLVLGSGTVKGFAYTLIISILLSMLTALLISKYLMQAFYAVGFKNEKFYGRQKERKTIDFLKHRVFYAVISVAVILAGVGGMIYYGSTTGKEFNYGIEFAGGTSTTADFGKEYTIEEIEKEIVPYVSQITKDSAIQATTVDESTSIVLKTRTLTLEEREALTAMLVEKFGVDEDTITSQSISSTISDEMRSDAIIAVIVACAFMLIYIRIRFKDLRFATSAIVALAHDVLVVLTVYALIRISVGNTLIAVVLTILGYSINDTIVIFDRIRENLVGLEKPTPAQLYEVANRSLTQTLGRSINTSLTTLITVTVLFILGVPAIREFALPMIIGMIAGSYSSLFIATELWYEMKVRIKSKTEES
ncbi:MAG: protein translocase subunit SecD [Agathobacter sp.]|nr:protein translocase subunit SecD [Agathobacter sp.]